MIKNTKLFVVLLAFATLTSLGCGGSKYPEVSGIVTVNGQPTPVIRVVFTPLSVGDNHSPGPWSIGVTDADGRFTLKTRHGESGAVVGPHRVGFHYDDITFEDSNLLGTKPKNERAKKRLVELKEILATRPKLKEDTAQKFEVTSEGTTTATFEIGE